MKKLNFVILLLGFFIAANNVSSPQVPVTGTPISEPVKMDTFSRIQSPLWSTTG